MGEAIKMGGGIALSNPKYSGITVQPVQKNRVAYLMGSYLNKTYNVKEYEVPSGELPSSKTYMGSDVQTLALSDSLVVIVIRNITYVHDLESDSITNIQETPNIGRKIPWFIERLSGKQFFIGGHEGNTLYGTIYTLSSDNKTLTSVSQTYINYSYDSYYSMVNTRITIDGEAYWLLGQAWSSLDTFQLYRVRDLVDFINKKPEVAYKGAYGTGWASALNILDVYPIHARLSCLDADKNLFVVCNTQEKTASLSIIKVTLEEQKCIFSVVETVSTSTQFPGGNTVTGFVSEQGYFICSTGFSGGYSNGNSYYFLCKYDSKTGVTRFVSTCGNSDIRFPVQQYPYGGSASIVSMPIPGSERFILSINDGIYAEGSTSNLYPTYRYREVMVVDDSIREVYAAPRLGAGSEFRAFTYPCVTPNGSIFFLLLDSDNNITITSTGLSRYDPVLLTPENLNNHILRDKSYIESDRDHVYTDEHYGLTLLSRKTLPEDSYTAFYDIH